MTRELQSTVEASGIKWPALRNHIPCMAHAIQLALGVFMGSLGVKGHTKSWEAHECDQQFGENESIDIGKSQRLRKEGNAILNKVSAMKPGLAKKIEKVCKGTYACVRPHRYTYGNYRNTVSNVDASDSRCIGKIIARDLRLMVSRLYRMPVTRPGSRAAVTLSSSLGADLLGCISRIRDKEKHYTIMRRTYLYKLKSPATDWHRTVAFRWIRRTGKLHLPLTEIRRW